jgi:hypothetical protein
MEVVVDKLNAHYFRIYEREPLKFMVGYANVLLGTVIQEILYNILHNYFQKKKKISDRENQM